MVITLVTCTYNAEAVLQRTLDSVLHQSYAHIEHLIIDGCSKDGTVAMAEQYLTTSKMQHTGHTVCIQSKRDEGLYDAMNKGLQKATGDYLCFLNAGDVLPDNDTIARLVASAQSASADGKAFSVLYGETDIYDENGQFVRHRRHEAPERLTWRSFRQGMLVCHQSFYANTAIARETPYDMKYRLSADVDWCIRIMKKGAEKAMQTHNSRQVLCHYLEGGMSVKNHRASLMERFRIMASHYGVLDTVMLHLWFVVRAVLKK